MKKTLVVLAAALLQSGAWATTYTFTGPTYTTLTPFTPPCATPTCGNFTAAMRQTGSFTTAAPLAPNLNTADISGLIQSYSFSDGLVQYNSGDAATRLAFAVVTTDAAGDIVGETIDIHHWQTASQGGNDRLDLFSANLGSFSNAYCQILSGPGACSLLNTDASTSQGFAHVGVGGWVTSSPPLQVAPTITSALPPGGALGMPYHFTVVATGTVPMNFTDAGTLPPGLAINANTGAITGTPTSAVSQSVTITANNGVVPSAVQTFTMTIAPAAGVVAVPTLGEWGLLLLVSLMAGVGWMTAARRRM